MRVRDIKTKFARATMGTRREWQCEPLPPTHPPVDPYAPMTKYLAEHEWPIIQGYRALYESTKGENSLQHMLDTFYRIAEMDEAPIILRMKGRPGDFGKSRTIGEEIIDLATGFRMVFDANHRKMCQDLQQKMGEVLAKPVEGIRFNALPKIPAWRELHQVFRCHYGMTAQPGFIPDPVDEGDTLRSSIRWATEKHPYNDGTLRYPESIIRRAQALPLTTPLGVEFFVLPKQDYGHLYDVEENRVKGLSEPW